jgi:hypothetical protein
MANNDNECTDADDTIAVLTEQKYDKESSMFYKKFEITIPNFKKISDNIYYNLIKTNNYLYWKSVNKKNNESKSPHEKIIDLQDFILKNSKLDSMIKNFCVLFIAIYRVIPYELLEKFITKILIRTDISIINYEHEMFCDSFRLFFSIFVKELYFEFVQNCIYFPNRKIKLLNFNENIQKHQQNTTIVTTTCGLTNSLAHFLLPPRRQKNYSKRLISPSRSPTPGDTDDGENIIH